MRVILDTNILCSALLTPGGPTDKLYRAWRDGRFVLLTSEQQLEEFYRDMLVATKYPPRVRVRLFQRSTSTHRRILRRSMSPK